MKSSLLCLAMLLAGHLYAQQYSTDNPDYIRLVESGFEALQAGKYDSCISYYTAAFDIKETSYLSTMRAAVCAYEKMEHQLTEKFLNQAFDIDWAGPMQVFDSFEEFEKYRDSPLADIVNEHYRKGAMAAKVDLNLIETLDEIRSEDQRYRVHMRETSDKYGWKSPQMDSLWALQSKADSINEAKISEIFEKYGYPGKSLVGGPHSGTAFLVIQHAPLEMQLKYLDLITAAADNGEVSWRSVALLVDRVRLGQGKKQLYGSQLRNSEDGFYFSPMEYPYQIDSMRNTVGLGPIQEYAERYNIQWDAEEHVRFHKELEKQSLSDH